MVIQFERAPSTGLSILVAGGGIAGLTFAIDATRRGNSVRVVERRNGLDPYGDAIGIQTSALRAPRQWSGFMERARAVAYPPVHHMKKYDGSHYGSMPFGTPEDPGMPINRSDLHQVLYEYARDVGIDIEFGISVVDYRETETTGIAILSDGRLVEADLVVAADGVGSKSWRLVTGKKEEPISSGFALYRTTYPVEPALKNPIIAKEFEGHDSYLGIFFGPGIHCVYGKTQRTIFRAMMHRENGNAEEDWTKPAPIENALPWVEGWTPAITEMVKATPNGTCVDYKLMWRNPQPVTVSPKGRVVQIGDSAHAFLPSSASGATMAMEDAAALATCLQVACQKEGEQRIPDVPLALRVFNLLRFERVSCAQKLGFLNREDLHKTDFEALKADPSKGPRILRRWLQQHDPEQYALDMYDAAASHLEKGTPFANTNIPPGCKYKPWKIQDLLAASDRGEKGVDEGDWS